MQSSGVRRMTPKIGVWLSSLEQSTPAHPHNPPAAGAVVRPRADAGRGRNGVPDETPRRSVGPRFPPKRFSRPRSSRRPQTARRRPGDIINSGRHRPSPRRLRGPPRRSRRRRALPAGKVGSFSDKGSRASDAALASQLSRHLDRLSKRPSPEGQIDSPSGPQGPVRAASRAGLHVAAPCVVQGLSGYGTADVAGRATSAIEGGVATGWDERWVAEAAAVRSPAGRRKRP